VPASKQQSELQNPEPGTTKDDHAGSASTLTVSTAAHEQNPQSPLVNRFNKRSLSSGGLQSGTGDQNPDHSLSVGERPVSNPYEDLKFEVFGTYKKRKMGEGHIQDSLDGIRDEIEEYAGMVRGKDGNTSAEDREQLRFLDEVNPLIDLQEVDEETNEIFGIQQSRLVIVLRSMFGVQAYTRLKEELARLGPDLRYIKFPQLIRAVLTHLVLQLFTKKDPIREAELRATEQST
jgi:hypothetical protein